ncbi:MAG: HAD-IA family hydrolase [Polyangiaceae bacterium]
MPRSIHAVVFDSDGTLVDSRADIAASANFALEQHGRPTHPESVIGSFVGDGALRLMARAASLPEDAPELPALLDTFLLHYAAHAADRTCFMPGVAEMLDDLDLPLAILTNKPRVPTHALLRELGVLSRFQLIVAGGDLPYLKPDPRLLFHVAEGLSTTAERLAMVGDGPQDILCAKAANALAIGVKGGIAAVDRLIAARPDHLLESMVELPNVIAEHRNEDPQFR